jgi:hypothetical protein
MALENVNKKWHLFVQRYFEYLEGNLKMAESNLTKMCVNDVQRVEINSIGLEINQNGNTASRSMLPTRIYEPDLL